MLKSTERSLGLLILWKCPRCEQERDFWLVTRSVGLSLLTLDFSRSKDMLDARCSTCAYEVRIDPSDSDKLKAISEITAQLKNSTIMTDDYRRRLDQVGSRLIYDLKALTETWQCPVCGEDNPVGFGECWKCTGDADTAGAQSSDSAEPPDIPGFSKGRNAWEQ